MASCYFEQDRSFDIISVVCSDHDSHCFKSNYLYLSTLLKIQFFTLFLLGFEYTCIFACVPSRQQSVLMK